MKPLYVELHTGLDHRVFLCPQPLLIPCDNNFLKILGKEKKAPKRANI
jgi:hypothetical protein